MQEFEITDLGKLFLNKTLNLTKNIEYFLRLKEIRGRCAKNFKFEEWYAVSTPVELGIKMTKIEIWQQDT